MAGKAKVAGKPRRGGKRAREGRESQLADKKNILHLPVLLSVVVTLLSLGLLVVPLGAVAILLLSVLELVLVELNVLLRARGRLLLSFGPRRSELDLLGGGGSGGGCVDLGLGLRLLVRRREDAEGDRDAGFKVQIDGCGGRRSKTFRNRPFAN